MATVKFFSGRSCSEPAGGGRHGSQRWRGRRRREGRRSAGGSPAAPLGVYVRTRHASPRLRQPTDARVEGGSPRRWSRVPGRLATTPAPASPSRKPGPAPGEFLTPAGLRRSRPDGCPAPDRSSMPGAFARSRSRSVPAGFPPERECRPPQSLAASSLSQPCNSREGEARPSRLPDLAARFPGRGHPYPTLDPTAILPRHHEPAAPLDSSLHRPARRGGARHRLSRRSRPLPERPRPQARPFSLGTDESGERPRRDRRPVHRPQSQP
jgi:hypothetical protein